MSINRLPFKVSFRKQVSAGGRLLVKSSSPGAKSPRDLRKTEWRLAIRSDVSTVAGWAEGPEEAGFVGSASRQLRAKEVQGWIDESMAAVVLTYPFKEGKRVPVAFCNVMWLQESTLEVGRLLVDPGFRRMGFGSTLFQNVLHAIRASRREALIRARRTGSRRGAGDKTTRGVRGKLELFEGSTVARVVPGNVPGQSLMDYLLLQKLDRGYDEKHIWYRDPNRIPRKRFGEILRDLRTKLGTSQGALAFRCGVERQTINMLESARRIPNIDLLQLLCRAVGDSQLDRVRLLLGILGEEAENLRSYPRLEAGAPKDRGRSLWIITDELAEQLYHSFYEDSLAALKAGYNRYYFVPRWEGQGDLLLREFAKDLGEESDAWKHLRIYEAPALLCSLRIVLANPAGIAPEEATVGGEKNTRVPLALEQGVSLYRRLNRIVKDCDLLVRNHDTTTNEEGFRQRFPGVSHSRASQSNSARQ